MKRKRWNRVYFLAPVILFITGAAIFYIPLLAITSQKKAMECYTDL